MKSPLEFHVKRKCSTTKARASMLILPHSEVRTPIFMPVGTQGTLKGLTTTQLKDLDCRLMLGNTYHLGLRPGPELMKELGGLHEFMNWDRSLLTDSGGFQMVSLLALAHIDETGVKFQSPHDGSELLLTPEKSIELQNIIGSDIMMQLDDVVSSMTTGPRVEEAMQRSIRWLDRCIAAHARPTEQNLFAIIQGGLDTNLREFCCREMVKRDLPGYAIGGLSGGEEKSAFWRVISQCTDLLPEKKPIYAMGVGYAVDLIVCVALGVDMFDCVYPSRTARFGSALSDSGPMNIKNKVYAKDFDPIDKDCPCMTCKQFTRAYLHQIATKEATSCHLLTIHNIAYQLGLMGRARDAILEDRFPQFVKDFMLKNFPEREYPQWIIESLASVNVHLE
eukprot:Nk52_evm18s1401 gene=Nk52_evmTU18s1401